MGEQNTIAAALAVAKSKGPNALVRVSWHRIHVVRDKDALILGGPYELEWISQTLERRLLYHDVINIWNFQLESSQKSLIEILVNQKAKHRE